VGIAAAMAISLSLPASCLAVEDGLPTLVVAEESPTALRTTGITPSVCLSDRRPSPALRKAGEEFKIRIDVMIGEFAPVVGMEP
jgi:hypothetical protein